MMQFWNKLVSMIIHFYPRFIAYQLDAVNIVHSHFSNYDFSSSSSTPVQLPGPPMPCYETLSST